MMQLYLRECVCVVVHTEVNKASPGTFQRGGVEGGLNAAASSQSLFRSSFILRTFPRQ